MLGRWVERMKRSGKTSGETSFFEKYLDAVCPKYVTKFHELMAKYPPDGSAGMTIDALDVLALSIVEALGVENADVAASRALLSILIENEHLPLKAQLTEQELVILRELLFCYFKGSQDVNEKGAQVLSLIEKKFSGGNFSQARILLQIFETNQETRQNNERNLYYEEMIARLDSSVRKAAPMDREGMKSAFLAEMSDEAAFDVFETYAAVADIHFQLYLRDVQACEKWRNVLQALPDNVGDYLLDYIPVIRWRTLGTLNEPFLSQIGRHMTFEMLRRHVRQKLRMCYFILLASGMTNFEWFIFSFTEWSQKYFNVDVRDVFPILHRSGIVDGLCLQEGIDMTLERFYGPAMNQIAIQSDALETAYRDALQFILGADLSQFPAGYYNFGDFLLDRILPFHYENPMFAVRLHRMM